MIKNKLLKWVLLITFQALFAGSLFCQTQEWTFTQWDVRANTARSGTNTANQYHKVYLDYVKSTFVWRYMGGPRATRWEGTFTVTDSAIYLKSDLGGEFKAVIDSARNVTCTKLNSARIVKYWGKSEP